MASSKKNKSREFNKRNASNTGKVKTTGNGFTNDKALFPAYVLGLCSIVYAAFLFILFPLYYEDKYYNMGDAKWHIYKALTFGFSDEFTGQLIVPFTPLVILVFLIIYYALGGKDSFKETASHFKAAKAVWICLAVYALTVILSTILTPYEAEDIFWGRNGWYMGLFGQLALCVMFFVFACFYRHKNWLIWGAFITLSIISLIAVGQRFGIDPLGLHEDLSDYNKKTFISTLGQTSWFSSYIVLIIPMAVGVYVLTENMTYKWLTGGLIFIEAMTMVTDDSDAGLLSFFIFQTVIFVFAFKKDRYMSAFFAQLCIFFGAFAVTGLLQNVSEDAFIAEGNFITLLTHSAFPYICFAVALFFAIFFGKAAKDEKNITEKIKFIRIVYPAVLGLGVVLLVIYVFLNSTGRAGSLSSDNNYLLFDDYWGNNRGLTWKSAWSAFKQAFTYDPLRCFIGAGPDQFNALVYDYCGEEMGARWNEVGIVFGNAHNEWLNELITGGIIGFIAYLGVFITSMIHFIRRWGKNEKLLLPAMCTASYIVHNFFCYQQILCSPAIFVIMGIGLKIAGETKD